ncbi:MAG: hypothetical protein K2P51_05375 [Rhabdochlamydiaceae bacterium]|nr:hypothetical protein [Rhabdochlamydiaceae bacterium]
MTSTFKAMIAPRLLRLVQKHPIGKTVAGLTGFGLEKIFMHCSLEIPDESLPGVSWIVTWASDDLNIQPEHVYTIQVLLKLVWLYSEQTDSPLKSVVAQELGIFEAGMKLEAIRRQQIDAAKKERPWLALDQWISKKLKSKTKWTSATLWDALPLSHDGDPIYRDEEKLHCSLGNYKSIGYRAFCDHVRRQREKNKCR